MEFKERFKNKIIMLDKGGINKLIGNSDNKNSVNIEHDTLRKIFTRSKNKINIS